MSTSAMVGNVATGLIISAIIIIPLFIILWLITISFLAPSITYDRWRYILIWTSFNNFISFFFGDYLHYH